MDKVRLGLESPKATKLGSSSSSSMTLQKKIVRRNDNVPDLTDFMNDMFFGVVDHSKEKKAYNLTGGDDRDRSRLIDEEYDFDDSTRSDSSRITQEWLEEAKRIVASSPTRTVESPSRSIGSPSRFAAVPARLSASSIDRRDPLSRSARRTRGAVELFSEEIISKSTNKHIRNKSSASIDLSTPPAYEDKSSGAAVHKWFSNILTPSTPSPPSEQTPTLLPPRQSIHRKSRFQTPDTPHSRRSFRTSSGPIETPLSPPNNPAVSAHRRSTSSSNFDFPLSPPKNLIESAHRRSISKSTCSLEKIRPNANLIGRFNEEEATLEVGLNGFLKEQRIYFDRISNMELDFKAKIVLPAASNSTSSMVAAICYAWLLENRVRKHKGGDENCIVVPVMNVRRAKMWKHLQTAWLFHHVGLDATSLLFADEVDLESLIMAGKLNILVVGQDVLKSSGEVGSLCSILTDNYCEDAYDLLQTPMLKKLLLAGILLDTKNLDPSASVSMTRDAEAIQLLLVGSSPNYKNALFDQLMRDQRDSSFTEALKKNYGNPPNGMENRAQVEHRVSERKSSSSSYSAASKQSSSRTHTDGSRNGKSNRISPKTGKPNSSPAQAKAAPAPVIKEVPDNSRGKSRFFLAKWFGFGSN